MSLSKQELLIEIHEKFLALGLDAQCPLEVIEDVAEENIMGYGTTHDEKIFSLNEFRDLLTRQRKQSEGMEMTWIINPEYHYLSPTGNAAVFADEITFDVDVSSQKITFSIRLSSVFEYNTSKWVLVHWHASKPEKTDSENDSWGIEEWKNKNAALEKIVLQKTAELHKSLEDLKAAQALLIHSEKMASLGELTAGIAHEIQNPLNFINNFSEVSSELIDEMNTELDKGETSEARAIGEDLKNNLEKVMHHGKRADAIVKGMLQHSRSSSGSKELTDINALADEYLRLAYHGLRAKEKTFNARFEIKTDPGISKINIIPEDIGRVILNLLTNAFYVVNEKKQSGIENYEPTVIVWTKQSGEHVEIIVEDNGNGIPALLRDKIFQPFFTTKPTGQGTGLGLSLSYDIITAHGGTLRVETKESEGTKFIIQLPLTPKN